MSSTCPKCGEPRIEDMSCPHCGIVYGKFNPERSEPVRPIQSQPNERTPASSEPLRTALAPRSVARQVVLFVGIIGIVLAIAIWGFGSSDESPAEPSEPFDTVEKLIDNAMPTIPALDNAASHQNRVQDFAIELDNVANDYANALDNAANLGRENEDDVPSALE